MNTTVPKSNKLRRAERSRASHIPTLERIKADGLCGYRALVKGIFLLYPDQTDRRLVVMADAETRRVYKNALKYVHRGRRGMNPMTLKSSEIEEVYALVIRHVLKKGVRVCVSSGHRDWKNVHTKSGEYATREQFGAHLDRVSHDFRDRSPSAWMEEEELHIFNSVFGISVGVIREGAGFSMVNLFGSSSNPTIFLISRHNGKGEPVHFDLNPRLTILSPGIGGHPGDGKKIDREISNIDSAMTNALVVKEKSPAICGKAPVIFEFQNNKRDGNGNNVVENVVENGFENGIENGIENGVVNRNNRGGNGNNRGENGNNRGGNGKNRGGNGNNRGNNRGGNGKNRGNNRGGNGKNRGENGGGRKGELLTSVSFAVVGACILRMALVR